MAVLSSYITLSKILLLCIATSTYLSKTFTASRHSTFITGVLQDTKTVHRSLAETLARIVYRAVAVDAEFLFFLTTFP